MMHDHHMFAHIYQIRSPLINCIYQKFAYRSRYVCRSGVIPPLRGQASRLQEETVHGADQLAVPRGPADVA